MAVEFAGMLGHVSIWLGLTAYLGTYLGKNYSWS